MIGGPIRQLMVSLGKVLILVQDDSPVALISGENKDIGDGAESEVQIFWIWRGWVVEEGWLEI